MLFPNEDIPSKIFPCPIIDSVLELKHTNVALPTEVVAAMLYEKFKEHSLKNNCTDKLGELQRLQINDIPLSVRKLDLNLQGQPHYFFEYDGLHFRIAMNNISVALSNEYPGWEIFKHGINTLVNNDNIEKIFGATFIRLGLRYTSFFEKRTNIFKHTNLEFTIFGNETLDNNNALLTNWVEEDLSCSLQVANNIEVTNPRIGTKEGSIIDIDVSINHEFNLSNLEHMLEKLHTYEKKVFFNVISDSLLELYNARTYALTVNHNYVLINPCIPLSLINPAIIELNNWRCI